MITGADTLKTLAASLGRIEARIRDNEERDRTIVHSDDNTAFDMRCALEEVSTSLVNSALALCVTGTLAHAVLQDELTRRTYAGQL